MSLSGTPERTCPICGGETTVTSRERKALSFYSALVEQFTEHRSCAGCGIRFRLSKFDTALLRLMPVRRVPHPTRRIDHASDAEFLDTFSLPIRPATSRYGHIETVVERAEPVRPPFLLELNNKALGLHLHLSFSGEGMMRALRDVVFGAGRICGMMLEWLGSNASQSRPVVYPPVPARRVTQEPQLEERQQLDMH